MNKTYKLTPKYKAFLATVEQVVVPKDIIEALSQRMEESLRGNWGTRNQHNVDNSQST